MARYLLSDDMHDVSLAARLLHLELPEDAGKAERRRELFAKYREWLRENRSFLYFTGEQFNLSSEPVAMRADPEAVYLQKEISPKNGGPASPLTEHELKSLLNFRERPREEQNLLAGVFAPSEKTEQAHLGGVDADRTGAAGICGKIP